MMPKLKANLHYILIVLLFFLAVNCKQETGIQMEVSKCDKKLDFIEIKTDENGLNEYYISHQGFCFNMIDSLFLSRKYYSGTGLLISDDENQYAERTIDITSKTADDCILKIKGNDSFDTAKTVKAYVVVKYKNQSISNTDSFDYLVPCIKQISDPSPELLDTSVCETSAGIGGRYLITFYHRGYCTDAIDSIGGNGDFYSIDGYYWNSSDFLVSPERIILPENTTFVQKIQFKLCVTFNVSDYVDTQFYIIYHDGSRSNKVRFDIEFGKIKNLKYNPLQSSESLK